jgi:ribonuclease P protein subunit POP4
MITKGNIRKHELIGLDVRVVSKDQDLTGLEGRVVDETRNLLTIETRKGEKKVPKKGATFEFVIPDGRVEVEGDALLFRPEDRIKRAR